VQKGVIAQIWSYFTEFDIFVGWLRHGGWRYIYNIRKISSYKHLAKTDPCSSRMVSLRQPSFLLLMIWQYSRVDNINIKRTKLS